MNNDFEEKKLNGSWVKERSLDESFHSSSRTPHRPWWGEGSSSSGGAVDLSRYGGHCRCISERFCQYTGTWNIGLLCLALLDGISWVRNSLAQSLLCLPLSSGYIVSQVLNMRLLGSVRHFPLACTNNPLIHANVCFHLAAVVCACDGMHRPRDAGCGIVV